MRDTIAGRAFGGGIFKSMALLVASLLLAGLPTAAPAQNLAQDPAAARPGRVRHELVPPRSPAHQFLHDSLARRKALERLGRLLSPFRLPRDVLIKVEGCDGDANAHYHDATIVVCYEYLDFVMASAPHGRGEGVRRRDAVIGPTVDVFLHEMGHAVFDLLKIPVLGREEDAADLFSAYILLLTDPQEARALITGVAFLGRVEANAAAVRTVEAKHYADVHGLPAQRYFNVICIAYGFDRTLFADAVTHWHLPAERAEGCAEEYQQLDYAFRTLIMPHIDPDVLAQVRGLKGLILGPPD